MARKPKAKPELAVLEMPEQAPEKVPLNIQSIPLGDGSTVCIVKPHHFTQVIPADVQYKLCRVVPYPLLKGILDALRARHIVVTTQLESEIGKRVATAFHMGMDCAAGMIECSGVLKDALDGPAPHGYTKGEQ